MLKIGCCEQVLDVPLFAELYGYGPFAGRRNRGILDSLYCRAVTFSDGEQCALIIYTDTCITADMNFMAICTHSISSIGTISQHSL